MTVHPQGKGLFIWQLPRCGDGDPLTLAARGQEMDIRRGDLLPHLSTADKAWLSDFLNRMRAKAEQEILP